MSSHSFLIQSIIYLGAAILTVPITQRLGLGSVIGYLLAGIIIGPYGLKFIQSGEDVLHFAEFGVVLLLFLIGLELNPKKLWELRKAIIGAGASQVLICCAIFTGLGLYAGQTFSLSLVAAMGFSLSSTAIALQLLQDRRILKIPSGETAFSVLLFQDLAVIPMLTLLSLMAPVISPDQGSPWIRLLKSIAAISTIVVAGYWVFRPIFRWIASTRVRELITGFSLFLVIGIATLMESVGLSMALGTFLAGVILAESEYRHELEVDIEPFKGLLLGLFFMSVGMSVNFGVILSEPQWVAVIVLTLVSIKLIALAVVGKLFGLSIRDIPVFAITLSQGGEFAFVLFSQGQQLGILPSETANLLVSSIALSMVTTPFLMMAEEKWLEPQYNWISKRKTQARAEPVPMESQEKPVIIAGFGRFGQTIGRLLHSRRIRMTILDHDPNQVELVRRFGWKAFYGDITRLELLKVAGAEQAKLLILAIGDMEAAFNTALLARKHFPDLRILVRVNSRPDAYRFINHGFEVFRETFGSSLEMAQQALQHLGYSAYEARKTTLQFREYDLKLLKKGAMHEHDLDTLISMAKKEREDLRNLMEDDELRLIAQIEDG